jgi:uncharacterized membrane protein YbhN (UPF0104 family)
MEEYNYEKEFEKDNPNVSKHIANNDQVVKVENPPPKKKNRTLQYYKFLHYAMKVEIKMHEFIDLIRFSNQSEISLWILSFVLYTNSNSSNQNQLVWFHLIHVVRGIMGMLLMLNLPRSYNLVESMNVDNTQLETKLFNDIAREVADREVVSKLRNIKGKLIFYFILTFVNFTLDVIDFFNCLSYLGSDSLKDNDEIIFVTMLIIAFLYIGNYLFIKPLTCLSCFGDLV